ncbi:isochorismatase family protein [Amycolatopsis sp. GA6-003]|uniref:isochorismatase family protein n=1 Tax=Amycolatopsis sp. GA6-003 TaxID=2652444 RepID=UPI003916E401
MTAPLDLDPGTTALVLVDLQAGVLGMPLAPLSGDEVAAAARELAARARLAGVPVVLVTVAFPGSGGPAVDASGPPMPEVQPPGWDQIVEGVAEEGDLRVVKAGWGAFSSTGLEALLRERGIETIVLAGVATNFGVEGTAREAAARGFGVVVVSDATSSVSAAHHDFSLTQILPGISRVRTAAEVVRGLGRPRRDRPGAGGLPDPFPRRTSSCLKPA